MRTHKSWSCFGIAACSAATTKQRRKTPPLPPFGWSPSPASAGADHTKSFSRRSAPEVCQPPQRQSPFDSLPSPRMIMRNKEGSGAPRGASNHGRAISGARQRAKQTGRRNSVRRSPALPGRARLPALHRGTSPTARLISGPRFLELPGANGRTLPGASAASTSRAGHSAGRYDARSRPGTGMCRSARGYRSRSAFRSTLAKASLDDSTSRMVFRNIIGDACQVVVIGMGTGSRRNVAMGQFPTWVDAADRGDIKRVSLARLSPTGRAIQTSKSVASYQDPRPSNL